MSGESPTLAGSWEVLCGGLLLDRPCHSGRRPALRARPGSRAVISSRALGEGSQGSPGDPLPGPCLWETRLGRTHARRAAILVPKVRAPRLAPGCQLCSRKPAPPKAGIRLNEHWAGRPGPGLPRLQPGGEGQPGASLTA